MAVCCCRDSLQLIQQSRILDRDYRLIREGLNELDLFLGKGVHLVTSDRECADSFVLPEQWYGQDRPVTTPAAHRVIG